MAELYTLYCNVESESGMDFNIRTSISTKLWNYDNLTFEEAKKIQKNARREIYDFIESVLKTKYKISSAKFYIEGEELDDGEEDEI